MKINLPSLVLLFSCAINSFAQVPERQQFIRTEAPVIALTRVRVIDGTGAAPKEDQTIVIRGGKIESVEPSSASKIPADAHVGIHRRRATHRKEHVVVHADQTRQDRVAVEV